MYTRLMVLFLAAAAALSACGTWQVSIEQAPTPLLAQPTPIVVTATPLPPQMPTQPATGAPGSPTPTADSACNRAAFVGDVTVPDKSIFAPNMNFIKTWRIKNVGTCAWTTAYKLVFYGDHKLSGPDWVNLPASVAPGAAVDLSVSLQAPAANGAYRSAWALSSVPDDRLFGIGPGADQPFWVDIRVSDGSNSGSTTTYRDSRGEGEMGFGMVFDYPSNWIVQPIAFGVQITSFDPANPPHKLEWTPSIISMSIEAPPIGWEGDAYPPPSASVLLNTFVENVKLEAVAGNLDIFREERLTLAGNPAARVTVVSGSGGVFDRVMIVMDGGWLVRANLEGGNFELARTVLDTLRQP